MSTTEKGIVSDLTRGVDWLSDGNNNFTRLRRMINEQWAPRPAAFSGLTYAYFGGWVVSGSGVYSAVADGTIALTDNADNYVERTTAGVVSKNTTGFSNAPSIPMAKVTTVSGAITAIVEARFYSPVDTGGGSGGKIAQVVNTQTGAVATGTTILPFDDTIPQNTEGNQYMSLAITPTSATNKLRIDVVFFGTPSTGDWVTAALFQDSTANALAAMAMYHTLNTAGVPIVFTHYMTAGTTSATTFKVRAGKNGAGTTTFNGQSAGRIFGGAMASSITITEIVP